MKYPQLEDVSHPSSHGTMMAKERRRSVALRLAAAVILASCFAQTAGCSRLKKAERRAGRNDAEVAKWLGVPEGRVVFGRVFKKGSGLESQGLDGTSTPTFNASAGDEAAYQADAPGKNKTWAYLCCKV